MRRVRKTLSSALSLLGQEAAELSVLFVGSRKMKTLNRHYRGIPKETDVLSFPMEDTHDHFSAPSRLTLHASRSLVLGDIVVSIPKTVMQARTYGASFYEELFRLLIHGLLHLLGYDHEKGRYQRVKMKKKENEILHAIANMD